MPDLEHYDAPGNESRNEFLTVPPRTAIIKTEMKITKITTIITVTAQELKQNIYEAFHDLIKESLEDDAEFFECEVDRLHDVIHTIPKHGFTPLFKDGYTAMLLPSEDMEAVETFDHQPTLPNRELEVRILDSEGRVQEVVKQQDLNY